MPGFITRLETRVYCTVNKYLSNITNNYKFQIIKHLAVMIILISKSPIPEPIVLCL